MVTNAIADQELMVITQEREPKFGLTVAIIEVVAFPKSVAGLALNQAGKPETVQIPLEVTEIDCDPPAAIKLKLFMLILNVGAVRVVKEVGALCAEKLPFNHRHEPCKYKQYLESSL